MNEVIDAAIKLLIKQLTDGINPDCALKLTQAALNLVHVRATFNSIAKS